MRHLAKMMMISAVLFGAISTAAAQTDSISKQKAFSFGASYIGDAVANIDGGIQTGTAYLGMANLSVGFDTEKAKWWKGGEFAANFGNTHGDEPSANLIGDLQVASNIEAGNLTYLFELWYKQALGKFEVTVGLQDLNANFVATDNGGLFINSSFGVHSVMSDNISLPIFPITALGANVRWTASEDFNWQVAIFDGTPNSRNAFNTNWILGKEDGYLLVTEMQVSKSLVKGQKGTYKLGGYYHNHQYSTDGPHDNGGIYIIADQDISNQVSLFTQIGISPNSINDHSHFYSFGLNYKEFCKKRPDDVIGLAIAYAGIDKSTIGGEKAIELTYKLSVNDNIFIQPDFQYIINPAGTGVELANAAVGFIRFGLEF